RRVKVGDGVRARLRQASLDRFSEHPGGGRVRLLERRRVPPHPQQDRFRRSAARGLWWCTAAAGNHGRLAHAGCQCLRDVRSNRDGRRHHRRPTRTLPAPRGYRKRGQGVGGAAPERRRDSRGLSPSVLGRSPDLFEGYWNKPEAWLAVLGTDGWMHTGDIGEWCNGCLRLIDRARDFLVTSGGKTVSPSFIENTLRASPYLAEAIVFGHGRKYLTALIEIDFETVADWARSND